MSESYRREERLFTAALALPDAERAAFLATACGPDGELYRRVEALLREHEAADDLLGPPPAGDLAEAARAASAGASGLETPGTLIGRYKLLEKIGEGGCGVVYTAEQQAPVRRRVALKVIKLGMDTHEVIARFEAERQALALMEHPHIARVLDAGATETGRPFFVMELVRGERITDYCDRHRLSAGERLRLFALVCQAVQHAHQKGVIHRDLKPSNILVTSHDGIPVPKVIDFGIAKATQGRLTDHTLYTAFALFIGTPAYMSPEQAGLNALDVDTRTDIYSLGVLLYELLTGRTPLETGELRQAGVDEIRRRIREQDLPRPSTRLRALDQATLTAAAAHRQIEAPKLVHLLSGDLDWIVMRCLEKDRTRRYETANALAREIERYLANEPVMARPPSSAYLLLKFIRRHRLGFAAGSAVAVALIAGVAVSTTLFLQEKASRERAVAAEQLQTQLRRQAVAEERRARAEAARSTVVARIMEDMLRGVAPAVAQGRDTQLLRQILDSTTPHLTDLQDQPEAQADLRMTLGQVYLQVGEAVRATELFTAALAQRRQLYGEAEAKTAQALNWLGSALENRGLLAEGEKCQREALATIRKLSGDKSGELIPPLIGLGGALLKQNRNREAAEIFQQELAVARGLEGDHRPQVIRALFDLGQVLGSERKFPEAATAYREILGQYAPDNAPGDAVMLRNEVEYKLGVVLWLWSRRVPAKAAEAESVLRVALAGGRQFLGEKNEGIGATLNILANVLADQGRLPEAIALNREAVAVKRKPVEREPDNREAAASLATSLKNLGEMLSRQDEWVEAESCLREGLAVLRQAPPVRGSLRVETLGIYGGILLQLGRQEEAERCFREALPLEEAEPDWNIRRLAVGLHRTLARAGKDAEADAAWGRWMDRSRSLAGRAEAGEFTTGLLSAMAQVGRHPQAEAFAREMLATAEKSAPDDWFIFALRTLLGNALVAQNRLAEAEPLLLTGCAGLRDQIDRVPTQCSDKLLFPFQNLEELYRRWGQPERADEWARKHAESLGTASG